MDFVIALYGTPSIKAVGKREKQVVPFVGADREGANAQMGVGLIFPDEKEGTMWGLIIPHKLVQSWRAMKILEELDWIQDDALCACWTLVKQNFQDSDHDYIEDLIRQLGGTKKALALRERILALAPTPDELETMIVNLQEKHVEIDGGELEREVRAGKIETSVRIDALIAEVVKSRQEYERQEEKIKELLPPEESLIVFFEDLRISNFTIGVYSWNYFEIGELDQIAKRNNFDDNHPEGHCLRHKSSVSQEIEHPQFTATDGARYTFMFAKFRNDHFFIKTRIEGEGAEPFEVEYNIKVLRDMIGPLPPKPGLMQAIIGRIASLFG